MRSSIAQCLWVDGAAKAEPAAVVRCEFAVNDAVALVAGGPLAFLAMRYTDVTHGERARRRGEQLRRRGDGVGSDLICRKACGLQLA